MQIVKNRNGKPNFIADPVVCQRPNLSVQQLTPTIARLRAQALNSISLSVVVLGSKQHFLKSVGLGGTSNTPNPPSPLDSKVDSISLGSDLAMVRSAYKKRRSRKRPRLCISSSAATRIPIQSELTQRTWIPSLAWNPCESFDAEQVLLASNDQLIIDRGGSRIDGFPQSVCRHHFEFFGVFDHHGVPASIGEINVPPGCYR